MRDIFCTLFLVVLAAFLVLSSHGQQFTMTIGSHTLSMGVQHSTAKLEARVAELEAAQAAQVVEEDGEEEGEDVVGENENVCDVETTCCASSEVQMTCAFNEDAEEEG
ncbi:MAG: hypothetical protein NTX72_01175 [Candidatus Uhrbacteria bacterium]|nr:hypothetical protein [Candidatus Uhrbacteria bacterium]